jgi:hypothetical protein
MDYDLVTCWIDFIRPYVSQRWMIPDTYNVGGQSDFIYNACVYLHKCMY